MWYNEDMIIPCWLWVVCGLLWLIALGFTGWGIWKIFVKSRRLLAKAELNDLVSVVEESKIFALEMRSKLKDGDPLLLFIDTELQLIDRNLNALYEQGGEKGARGTIYGIRATKEIAQAAAFFALASFSVGISAALIAIFN
ncbi:MAG TPA: hypothetical protein G4N91_00225 [Dehalococcoidia bacterium]|nr:hypothetical protein [Dehalococcoidia bacterium]